MAATTPIEWTEATWNPIVGCSLATPGCTNCYAMRMAARLDRMGQAHYAGLTQPSKAGAIWTSKLALAPESILLAPLRRRKPTTYFVNSMGDLFHEDAPDEWIDRVFAVMALCPQHTFQVLTKRSGRMRAWFSQERPRGTPAEILAELYVSHPEIAGSWPLDAARAVDVGKRGWPLPNVWLGVSAEDQPRADVRVPDLLATPAAVRFVSAEPLLGPIDFRLLRFKSGDDLPDEMRVNSEHGSINALSGISTWPASHYQTPVIARQSRIVEGELWQSEGESRRIEWIIVGGESGPSARPMHPDWARSIRDQCKAAGVPFFFKQWGEWLDEQEATARHRAPGPEMFDRFGAPKGNRWHPYEAADRNGGAMIRVGKARAGRFLDGRTHDDMPEVRK